jgi:hypothetical protein
VLHRKRGTAFGLLIGGAVVALIGACADNPEAGKSCPLLCPQQSITLRDTTVDAVVSDTTVNGLPAIGMETFMMLSSHGDTVDTRAIVRFDTIVQTYSKSGSDSTIVHIDTAQLIVPLAPDSLHHPPAPVTIELYNVDTAATDTVASILGSLFRPDRFLGSKTFAPESVTDTLTIPISTDTVLDRILKGTHLRIGFRVVSRLGVDLRLGTTQSSTPVTLRIKPSLDTSVTPLMITPVSNTPVDQTFLSGPLADYTIVVKGNTVTPAGLIGVGGVPSRRTFFRFDVPSRIVDSTTVVRASLLLTQIPNRRLSPHDSVFIYPVPVLAGPTITDISSALQFIGANGQFGLDSISMAPSDSGTRSFELVGLVRTWRGQPTTVSPRTVALRSGGEGSLPAEFNFFSTRSANVALRPRLRITYIPPFPHGLP